MFSVRFLMVLIAATVVSLAAIYFLLPPAPVNSGGEPPAVSESPGGVSDPFALLEINEAQTSDPDGLEPTLEQVAAYETMHADLPGNIFLPVLPSDVDRGRVAERDAELRRMRALHFKIEKDQASLDERERYFGFRIQYNRDKIAMLKYVAVKSPGDDGHEVLPPLVQQMIDDLKRENEEFADRM